MGRIPLPIYEHRLRKVVCAHSCLWKDSQWAGTVFPDSGTLVGEAVGSWDLSSREQNTFIS
jgi:hypothetical protein